jgi:hypothetical protein
MMLFTIPAWSCEEERCYLLKEEEGSGPIYVFQLPRFQEIRNPV